MYVLYFHVGLLIGTHDAIKESLVVTPNVHRKTVLVRFFGNVYVLVVV